jgi:mutator protein MutT
MMNTHPQYVLKYCPRCGSSHFLFEGERSFKCQDCSFHFFINASCAVAAIIENDKEELLFTIRAFEPNKGMLDLPGGFVDPLETAEDAVKREIKEELGLEVETVEYLTSFPNEYVFSGFTVYTIDLGFIVKVKSLEIIEANDDISGYEFIAPNKVDRSRLSSPSLIVIMDAYLNKKLPAIGL